MPRRTPRAETDDTRLEASSGAANPPGAKRPRRRPAPARAAWVALSSAALWWVLAGPENALDPLGAAAVLLAVMASLSLPAGRPAGIRLIAVPRLLAFFLRLSVAGGVDVSLRAIRPSMPISPGFIHYRSVLPHGLPLALFMGIVSLLPGTLSVRVQGRRLIVHVLNRTARPGEELAQLEQRVAAMFSYPRLGERREGGG